MMGFSQLCGQLSVRLALVVLVSSLFLPSAIFRKPSGTQLIGTTVLPSNSFKISQRFKIYREELYDRMIFLSLTFFGSSLKSVFFHR